MPNTQHTPAPWISTGITVLRDQGDYYDRIAVCDRDLTNSEANANLIAAAPELLADLERAIELLTQVYGADTFIKEAMETINKAKGL